MQRSEYNIALDMVRREVDQAIKNNQKIFPVFQKRLSTNDTAQWLSTAKKFGVWLDSEKAYYPSARPHIIQLLQTAQTTLRHQNNDDLSVPFNPYTYPPHLESWTSAYISLCNIVDKFIDKFSNSERDQLLTLIRTSGSGHQPPNSNSTSLSKQESGSIVQPIVIDISSDDDEPMTFASQSTQPVTVPVPPPTIVSATLDRKPKAKTTVGVSLITTQTQAGIPLPIPPRPRPRPRPAPIIPPIPSTSPEPPPPVSGPTPAQILALANIDTNTNVATSTSFSPAYSQLSPLRVLPGSTPASTPFLVNNSIPNMDILTMTPTPSSSAHTPVQVEVRSPPDVPPQPESMLAFMSSPTASYTNHAANLTTSHPPTQDQLQVRPAPDGPIQPEPTLALVTSPTASFTNPEADLTASHPPTQDQPQIRSPPDGPPQPEPSPAFVTSTGTSFANPNADLTASHPPAQDQLQVRSASDGPILSEPTLPFVPSPTASFTNPPKPDLAASHPPSQDQLPLPGQTPTQTSTPLSAAPLSLSKGKRKRTIPDDLAMSDLEWLRTKPKRKSSAKPPPIQVQIIDLTKDDDDDEPVTGAGMGMGGVGLFQPAMESGSEVKIKNEDEDDVQMIIDVDADTSTSVNGNQPCVEEPKPMDAMEVEEQVAPPPDTHINSTLAPCVEPTTSKSLPELPEGPDTHEPEPANDMTTLEKTPNEGTDVHRPVASESSVPDENPMLCTSSDAMDLFRKRKKEWMIKQSSRRLKLTFFWENVPMI